MKPLTREWVEKAEADFTTANREFRARKAPNYDDVCFHCEQCVEKYLKARLQEAGIPFEKTHNLIALLTQALGVEPTWELLRPRFSELNAFAVIFRYPGESASRETARRALDACKGLRQALRQPLGVSDGKTSRMGRARKRG